MLTNGLRCVGEDFVLVLLVVYADKLHVFELEAPVLIIVLLAIGLGVVYTLARGYDRIAGSVSKTEPVFAISGAGLLFSPQS